MVEDFENKDKRFVFSALGEEKPLEGFCVMYSEQ